MLTNSIPTLAISDRQNLHSMAYVRAIIATAGFNFSKSELDRNSDDLSIWTFDKANQPSLMADLLCQKSNSIHPRFLGL
jgi:predicted methyltransferase